MPIKTKLDVYLGCPSCGSKDIHAEQKGFSGGKALVGSLAVGGIGILAGTIGSRDVNITCLKCGKKFKAGEAKTITVEIQENSEIDNLILKTFINAKGQDALDEIKRLYSSHINSDFNTFKDYIDRVAMNDKTILTDQQKEMMFKASNMDIKNIGCMSAILIFLSSSCLIYTIIHFIN
ncbi:DNA-directed RNA polymerase subunit RPC12/RpoP [Bacteroides reticulotermitis]|nr:DNA-directed RNA polymerase subunit RPC12/RpoP [Bacteroides reticulotermitis]